MLKLLCISIRFEAEGIYNMAENDNVFKDQEALKKANRYFLGKMIFNLFLVIFGAILIGLFL